MFGEKIKWKYVYLSGQIRSVAQSCQTLCDPMSRSMPGLPVHHQLPEFTQTQRPSSQWCHPAISSSVFPFSSCPQSLPASVFSNESTLCMRWPKYWSFSFSIIPSKEIPGLFIHRQCQYFVENSEEYTKSFLELINGFSRNAGCSQHKIPIVFPYVSKE